jgi:hypothetical protein
MGALLSIPLLAVPSLSTVYPPSIPFVVWMSADAIEARYIRRLVLRRCDLLRCL